jgi:hypothetical protein
LIQVKTTEAYGGCVYKGISRIKKIFYLSLISFSYIKTILSLSSLHASGSLIGQVLLSLYQYSGFPPEFIPALIFIRMNSGGNGSDK